MMCHKSFFKYLTMMIRPSLCFFVLTFNYRVSMIHEERDERVDLGVADLEHENADGQDGVIVGAGLVEPGDGNVGLSLAEKVALADVVDGPRAGLATHRPSAPFAQIRPVDLTETTQT